jgi:hypothetical protein
MPTTRSGIPFERRAVVAGLLAFLVLAFALPLIVTVVASLGPREWVTDCLAPAKQFQSVLTVLVGAVAGWWSRQTPLTNCIIVGLVGGLGLLAVAAATGASPHLGVAAAVFQYIVVTVAWCVLGGLGASLLRRNRHAL